MKDKPFSGQVVVLTGASSGIGHAMALQLADQNAKIVLAARDRQRLKGLEKQCREKGASALAVPTDVAEESQCHRLIETTIGTYGGIDCLINNAGVSMWSRFEDLRDLQVLETLLRVNYLGAAYCTYHALPHLKKSSGRIAAISSLAGKTGIPTRAGYAASKHAMHGFFDTLRIELRGSGVSVTIVCPGFVATEVRQRAFGANGLALGQSHMQETGMMSAERCAQLSLAAIAGRKRELLMTFRGKMGPLMKILSPDLVDSMALKVVRQSETAETIDREQ